MELDSTEECELFAFCLGMPRGIFLVRVPRWFLHIVDVEEQDVRKPSVLFHSQLRNSHDQHQFHGIHVPAEKERDVPSSSAQEAILGLDQRDLVGREAQRFIAYDKITLAVQIPPLILILRTQRVRRKFDAPCWGVFAAAEIELPGPIDGIDLPHRQMYGKSVNLIFRVENPSYVSCRILP